MIDVILKLTLIVYVILIGLFIYSSAIMLKGDVYGIKGRKEDE